MSWKIEIRPPQTLVTKLALCIFVLMIGSSMIGFLVTYWAVHQRLYQIIDHQLAKGLNTYRDVYASQGLDATRKILLNDIHPEDAGDTFFRILDLSGKECASSNLDNWETLIKGTQLPPFHDSETPIFVSVGTPVSSVQARVMYAPLGTDLILQRGEMLKEYRPMNGIWTQFLISFSLLTFLGVFASAYMAYRAMSGVRDVTKIAAAISRGDWTQRVNIRGRNAEIDELADTFNGMLNQIETLLNSLKEVTDDITHDLRSPITLIRGLAERFALSTVSDEEHQQISGAIVEGCDRLLNLINTMLDISEMNAGAANLEKGNFDLTDMLRDTCELFQPLAEDSNVSLELRPCASVNFWGDKGKLHRALANLVDNAIKCTPPGGHIVVSLQQAKNQLAIAVEDDGVGIDQKELVKVFERFYRPDHSRTQPGNGLGLSLSMAIVKAHGGTITVESVVAKGSRFTIVLPWITIPEVPYS